jgi:hypothetical protein
MRFSSGIKSKSADHFKVFRRYVNKDLSNKFSQRRGNKSFLSIKFGELENFRDRNLKWNIEENSGIKYIKLKKDIGRRKTKEIKLTAKTNKRGNLISIKSIEIIKEKTIFEIKENVV